MIYDKTPIYVFQGNTNHTTMTNYKNHFKNICCSGHSRTTLIKKERTEEERTYSKRRELHPEESEQEEGDYEIHRRVKERRRE
jgi:hypothetical protein